MIWTDISDITLTSDWSANEYTITFNGNGGIPTIGTQLAVYDMAIETLGSCQRTGYAFLGWNTSTDGSGQAIANPFIYVMSYDVILYAQWQIIEYSITYNLNGGTQASSNLTTYKIESDNITFDDPSKFGYTFVNWKNGNSLITGIPTGSYGNLNLVAYLDANQYTITLDANGGSNNGVNSFSVLEIPTRTGYTFEGWYDSEGVKYMTALGESTRLWDKATDTTLIADWEVKSYEIQINNNGSITWLGASGILDYQCSIEYGTVLNAINLISTFKDSDQGYKEVIFLTTLKLMVIASTGKACQI